MFESMSITSQGRAFQCPSCKEKIDTSRRRCPFCSAIIDAGAAEAAADAMVKVNQASEEAGYVKVAAGVALASFLCGMFFVFISMGVPLALLAVVGMAIRWRVKYGGIQTDDLDFHSAKRTVTAAGITASLLLLGGLILVAAILATSR
jgi:hypothetical protein